MKNAGGTTVFKITPQSDGSTLKLDGGDGCTTVQLYEKSLSRIFTMGEFYDV